MHYDIAIIGTGPGGYVAALKAAQLGANVAVIEKSHLGGTCLNWGCIPSKALLSSAELVYQIKHAGDWGVTVSGQVAFDWKAIQKRKDKVIRQNRAGIASLFKGRKVTHITGTATFDGPGKLAVTNEGKTEMLTADQIIIATGSVPSRIPGWPEDPERVCTSDESVHWKSLPKKLLIVGGGVIGCEFACMCNAFGVDVTVVEMLPNFLAIMDHSLGDGLVDTFKKRGIACHVDTKVEDLQTNDSGIVAKLSNGEMVEADRVLVATGRKPNTTGLGLETLGIELTRRGFIPVNEHMRTNAANHYAIGDVNGQCLLAHAASAHGVCAVENALGHAHAFDKPIPSAVYTFPEIASVGLAEHECVEKQLPIAVGMFPLSHLGKAMASNHTEGFVKTIRHRETGALLGCHMLGHNATECIHAASAMLNQKATMHDLAEAVFAHPTLSEAIKESAEDALGMGLHLPPRKIITAPATI